MNDPADIDGDGEFDAIDISIMENSDDSDGLKNNGGCCVLVLLLGAMLIAGLGMVDYLT